MKTARQCAFLLGMAALLAAPRLAVAEDTASGDAPYEVTLDMDNDGKLDRVVIVRDAAHGLADLSIYLNAGDRRLDPSLKPTFIKKALTVDGVLWVESKPQGALALTYGCGGCSNDYETTLTIAYRGGEFLVTGYTYGWETRESAGTCDINFLTGKGTMSEGIDGEGKPIDGTFRLVRLADWTDGNLPKACEL
jgi:hypothetical protein